MKKNILIVFLIFFYAQIFSQGNYPNAKSIFWEISGNNLTKPSYIYGTMHVSKKIAFKVPDSFFNKLKSVDIVALETNPELWEKDIVEDEFSFYLKNLFNNGNSYSYDAGNYYTKLIGINPLNIERIKKYLSDKSNVANHLQFRKDNFINNLEEDTYLDMFIYQAGKKFQKPVIGLETVINSNMNAIRAEFAQENNTAKKNRNFFDRTPIETLYEKRDIGQIDTFYQSRYADGYLQYMLYNRNDEMMATLDSLLKQNKSVFVAIGAGHLPNERGILALLVKKGYKVKPIFSSENYDPSTEIMKLDSFYLPQQFGVQYVRDSTISYNAPGYPIRTAKGKSIEYINPDLVNNFTYSLVRIPHFAPFMNYDKDSLLKSVQSVLYESTSGKLISKNKLKQNGYDALEIISQNAQGDFQKQLIVFSPFELLIFKATGDKNILTEKIVEPFFSSINIKYNQKVNTTRIEEISMNFPVSMSDLPFPDRSMFKPSVLLSGQDENKDDYIYIKAAGSSKNNFEVDSFETNIMADLFAENSSLEIVSQTVGNFKGMTSSISQYKNKKGEHFYIRTLHRNNVYYLWAIKTNNNKKAMAFFNSIDIHTNDYLPLKPYRNTKNNYHIQTAIPPFGKELNEEIYTATLSALNKNNEKRNILHLNSFISENFGYETIINISQFSPLECYVTLDTFWSNYMNELKYYQKEDVNITTANKKIKDNYQSYTYYFSDTNCSVIFANKAIITGDKLYEIKSVFDTSSPLAAIQMESFNSFDVDATFPITILTSKIDTVVKLLFSSDSTEKSIFNKSYTYYNYHPGDEKKILTLLDTSSYLKKKEDVAIMLFTQLEKSPNKFTLDALENLYKKNTNYTSYQIEILKTLAYMNDTQATLLFKKLIVEDPPLASDDYDYISYIFDGYFGNKKTVRLLYPEILELLDYDDYKTIVIRLTSSSYKKNYIDTSHYSHKLPYLLRKAKEELKRLIGNKSMDDEAAAEAIEAVEMASEYGNNNDYEQSSYSLSEETEILDISNYSNSKNDEIPIYKVYLYSGILNLLQPLSKDRHVADFFAKTNELHTDDIKLFIAIDRMEDSLSFNKEIIKKYAEDDKYKLPIIHKLFEYKQNDLIKSILPTANEYAALKIKSINDLSERDTIIFIKAKTYIEDAKPKTLFIYKFKREDEKDYKYAFFGTTEKNEILPNRYVILEAIPDGFEDMTLNDMLKKIDMQMRVRGRKRISMSDFAIKKKNSDNMTNFPYYNFGN